MRKKLSTTFQQHGNLFFESGHNVFNAFLSHLRKEALTVLCLIVIMIAINGGGAVAQTTTDYNWKSLAIGGGGFVSAVIPSKTQQNLVYARTDVGGAYRWNASSNKWVPLTDWVSEDQVGFLGVESLALDPNNSGRLYMLVGISYFNDGKTSILRSDDYGNTFTITEVTSQFKAHGNGMGRQTGEKLVVDPNNSNVLYCGTRWNGLFKSTNSGSTWSRVTALNVTTTPNENGISFVALDPSSKSGGNTQRIFVGVSRSGSAGANFYRSDNGGQSFTAVSGAPSDLMPHRAVMAGNGNLYVTYGNGAGPHGHKDLKEESMDKGQIWKYNISTGVWTNVTPSGFSGAFGGISIDPNDPNRIVASSINTYWYQYRNTIKNKDVFGDRIFLSTNGGSSWVDVVNRGFTLDTDNITWIYGHSIHWAGSIEFDPFNTKKVWVTSGNGIFVNDDINTNGTWRFNVRGIEETVPLGLESIANGPVISVIGDYDGFRHTNLNEYAPIHEPQMGTTTGLAVAGQNTGKMVRVGNSMYYSTDTGVTWTQCTINGTQGKVAISANGNVFLHSPKDTTLTYRSTNNGASWSLVNSLTFRDARVVGDGVNANKFYAYNPENGAVMVSTNGGSSFSQAATVSTWGSKVIRLTPGKEGHVWIALNNGGLTRSTDSGQSFSTISGVSHCGAVGFGVAASGANYPTIYIWGTVNNVKGVFRSTDQAATWVRVNDDAHEYGGPGNGQFIQGDMNVFGRVYMSTAGRGIVYGEPACTPSSITPYLQVNGGAWQQASNATLVAGQSLMFGPQPVQGGSWSWSGPNNFSASTREVTISNMQTNQAGSYIATYTNSGGCQSSHTFNITVNPPCTPTSITPYVQVNGGTWQQTANASLNQGGNVMFGPQPSQGGSWSWSGPNNYSASSREVYISNIQFAQVGSYIATYTNNDGCQSTQTFNVTVTGSILREYWTGISGTSVSNLTSNANYPNSPSGSGQLTSLEGPTNWADNYGTRIRGYIHPQTSGNYTFWIAGDDNADLFLSSNDNPANSTKIASVSGWTNSREWNKYTSQQSAAISLTAGQRYYIEVLHKEGSGGDNIAVAWQGPGITQQVIGGSYLSPFVTSTLKSANIQGGDMADAKTGGNTGTIKLYPNPVRDGKFTILLPELSENAVVKIFNSQGNLICEKVFSNQERLEIEAGFKTGIYIVMVNSEGVNFTSKLIVQ